MEKVYTSGHIIAEVMSYNSKNNDNAVSMCLYACTYVCAVCYHLTPTYTWQWQQMLMTSWYDVSSGTQGQLVYFWIVICVL